MSDYDDDDMGVVADGGGPSEPAYVFRPAHFGETTSRYQCKSSSYCYLCKNIDQGEALGDGEENDYRMLVDYISALVAQSKGVVEIATHVHKMYNKAIRWNESIKGTGKEFRDWTVDAIVTHLTTSRQWPELRDSAVTLSLFNMYQAEQERVIDSETGKTHEEGRKACIETAKAYFAARTFEARQEMHKAQLRFLEKRTRFLKA